MPQEIANTDAPTVAEYENALLRVSASLAAAISLLERGGRTAAPSDKMFNQMLEDYRSALGCGRDLLRHNKAG